MKPHITFHEVAPCVPFPRGGWYALIHEGRTGLSNFLSTTGVRPTMRDAAGHALKWIRSRISPAAER